MRRLFPHTFELAYGALCALTGLLLLGSGLKLPVSLVQVLPTPLVVGWGLGLLLGGVAVLAGLTYIRDLNLACGMERAGLRLTGSAWLVYMLMLIAVPRPTTMLAYLVACFFIASVATRLSVLAQYERRRP